MNRVLRIGAVVIAAVASAFALRSWSFMPHACNAAISEVTVRTEAAGTAAGDYERLLRARRNLAQLAAVRDSCATEVRVAMLAAANEELLGRLDDAARSYALALRTEQRPEIYVALALVQIQLGQIDEAVTSYTTAARFNPSTIDGIGSEEITRRVRERIDGR